MILPDKTAVTMERDWLQAGFDPTAVAPIAASTPCLNLNDKTLAEGAIYSGPEHAIANRLALRFSKHPTNFLPPKAKRALRICVRSTTS